MLQIAFVDGSIAHDAAPDALDARLPEEGFPLPEQPPVLRGDAVLGTQGGVAVADEINVPLQHAVPDGTRVAHFRGEAEIRAEGVQGRAGGHQLQVGGRDHALLLVVSRQYLTVAVYGQHAPDGIFQDAASLQLVHVLLCRALCRGKMDRQQEGQS